MPKVLVSEVGPRDGLQLVTGVMATSDKIRWIRSEAAAGVSEIEVGSFVPARILPQFADMAELVRQALTIDGLTVAVLSPNLRGVQDAIAAGAHKVTLPVSASEGHSLANVRKTRADQVEQVRLAVEMCRASGRDIQVCAGISCAFGCSIEGEVPGVEVARLAEALAKAGASDISLADSVGYAGPSQIRSLFPQVRTAVGSLVTTAHLHDTRGLGLANVLAAMEVDIWCFDSSLGGLGGCPYSPGATGNIATEDLVYLCDTMGIETGIDLERLLEARSDMARGVPNEPLLGKLGQAGLPRNWMPLEHLS